jgi:hypothetical protein
MPRRKYSRKMRGGSDPSKGRKIGREEGGFVIKQPATRTPPPSHIDPYYLTESWKQKRLYVVRRDDETCQHCGLRGFQADHVIPRSAGGSDKVKNLVCCCARCNKLVGGRVFESFEAKKAWILEALDVLHR